jgi:hypothetical protein
VTAIAQKKRAARARSADNSEDEIKQGEGGSEE